MVTNLNNKTFPRPIGKEEAIVEVDKLALERVGSNKGSDLI